MQKKGGAEYEKTLEDVDIHSGENTLEFELELKATGSEGSGTVKIDVSFAKGFSPLLYG
ncbi:MAG: hypothetical protein K6A43_12290 [Treponema sp.]|nr:hypothetical protein [Treponema sp.]